MMVVVGQGLEWIVREGAQGIIVIGCYNSTGIITGPSCCYLLA